MLTKKQHEVISLYLEEGFDEKAALTIFPFRYETRELVDERFWEIGQKVVFEGKVVSQIKTARFKNRSITRFRVQTSLNEYDCVIYNNRFVKTSFENQVVSIVAVINDKRQLVVQSMNQKEIQSLVGIIPIYPLKQSVSQYQMTSIMKKLLKQYYHAIEEAIPLHLTKRYKLLTTREAVKEIHFPHSHLHLKQAIRTLKYHEALRFQVAIALTKKEMKKQSKVSIEVDTQAVNQFISNLPFQLTIDQQQTLSDVLNDIQAPTLMRRLVLGDVGSGKTVIALIAIVAICQDLRHQKFQTAFLCPTEVLAQQHYQTFQKMLPSDIKVGLLIGSMTTSEKNEVISQLANNQISCIIGTHALLNDSIQFDNLRCVIMDEQHRFGVQQRQTLINKGKAVDVLMLSATPIPRTLAASLYSHLDISTIETMPSNRLKIQTELIRENTIRSIVDEILQRIANQDQCYIICASISDDNKIEVRNVETITRNLMKTFRNKIRIGHIHGQMDRLQISETLTKFKNHQLDMLVSTTVVEVGIHIETANTMVIYNAERFGLSQLHQLRGRIGRGDQQAKCFVLTDSQDPTTLSRLEIFEKETSGFNLSMMDLKLRGSGDLLGVRQSGMPQFTLFNPIIDEAILKQSHEDALEVINSNQQEDIDFCQAIELERETIVNSMI